MIVAVLAGLLRGSLPLETLAMLVPTHEELTQVQFIVATPDPEALQPAEIYCAMSIDGWTDQGRALGRVAPGVYAGQWPLVIGAMIEYKFLREPSWKTVEKGEGGIELPNRALTVGGGLAPQVFVHTVTQWADRHADDTRAVRFIEPGGGRPIVRVSTVTGDVRAHHRVHSPQLRNARTVLVYLPPGYDDHPDQRYPVLYLHDGQNVFDARTAFGGVEWEADETADKLIRCGAIEPIIIVAIYNNEQRIDEYTPFRDAEHGGGRADAYLAFLIETLKPMIDRTYRTRGGPEDTAIGGASLGGLVSLYGLLRDPDVFGRAIVMSPSLQWADQRMLAYVQEAKVDAARVRLWLDVGGEEGLMLKQRRFAVPLSELSAPLVAALKELGLVEGVHLAYRVVPGAQHHERDWAARFDQPLLFHFGRKRPEKPGASAPAKAPKAESPTAPSPSPRAPSAPAAQGAGARR